MSESLINIFPLIFISAAFYFIIIRPQQRKNKEKETMLSNIKEGDKLILSSGIYATLKNSKKEELFCIVEISKNTEIKINKSEIVEILS